MANLVVTESRHLHWMGCREVAASGVEGCERKAEAGHGAMCGLESCQRRFQCAECVCSCGATWLLLLKRIGHMEQAYGFSLV